jgi:capsular exopolysaccharide synthesis family protein
MSLIPSGPSRVHPLPSPPALSESPNVLGLLKALRRRWRLALSLGLVVAAMCGSVTWFALPPMNYLAASRLRLAATPPKILFPTEETQGDYAMYRRTQIALIRSRNVLKRALQTPGLAESPIFEKQGDPTEWLRQHIQVEFPEGSEFLEISLQGRRPRDLVALIDAVTTSYLLEVAEVEQTARRDRLGKLEALYDRLRGELAEKQESLRKMTDAVGSADSDTLELQHQYAIASLDTARRELRENESDLKRVRAELAIIRQHRQGSPPITREAIEAKLREDPKARACLDDIAKMTLNLRRIKRIARGNDISIQRLNTTLQEARAELARYEKEAVQRLTAEAQQVPDTVAALEDQLAVLQLMVSGGREEVDRLAEAETRFRRATVDFVDLIPIKTDIEHAEAIAAKVADAVQALKVELGAPPRIQLVEPAEVQNQVDKLREVKMAGLTSLGGLGLVVAAVSLWEFRARRVSAPSEVAAGLGLRVVGTIPRLPSGHGRRAITGHGRERWENRLLESIDAIRTMLLRLSELEETRVVMVAGAIRGEGKTSLSVHLATSMARSGRRTLLVDGDFRSPTADRLFDVPPTPGLCELLRGEADLAQIIAPTSMPNLYVIPAGLGDDRAVQAMSQQGARGIFDRLRDQFDYVVIDSSPVLSVVDPLLICGKVDGVLLSVLRDVSRIPAVYAAADRIAMLGARILGVVVSGAPGDGSDYYPYRTATQLDVAVRNPDQGSIGLTPGQA